MLYLCEGETALMLEREYQYYKTNETEFIKQYEGKFLGIVGEEIVGVFTDDIVGYQDLKNRYGLGKFLIQHCIPARNHIQRYHSRVAFC